MFNQLNHQSSRLDSSIVSLLRLQPLFCHASENTLQELSKKFHSVGYRKNQIVVQQDEIIDSVYVVYEGEAKVNKGIEIVAFLHKGESIGLNDTGFFSETGTRTATVIANTNLLLLRLDILDFNIFLENHPEFNLYQDTDLLLRLNFLKQIEPFSDIDPKLLREVANNIDKIKIPAHKTIFQQGDKGDRCYLLCVGKINITLTQADGAQKILAELEPINLLGEMALLTESVRNATARSLTPCELLVLEKKQFLKLINSKDKTSEDIILLVMDRDRPKKVESVSVHTRQLSSGETTFILKNPIRGNYMQISEESLFVWNLLDSEHTLQDIALEFYQQYQLIEIDEIGNLIFRFINAGFVESNASLQYKKSSNLVGWERIVGIIRNIMECEYALKNTDVFLTQFYNRIGYIFYTQFSKIIMALFALVGFFAFIAFFNQAAHILHATPHAWVILALQSPALLLVIPLHEFAHALTTKFYGRSVNKMGVGWFWLGPIAFTDTSDMWLSNRRERTMVNISGIYLNVVIAGFFALLAWITPYPIIAAFLWTFSLTNYLCALANSNPIIELDGYYILMDLFDRPNLRAHAIIWLLNRSISNKTLPEICYWISCVLFLIVSVFTTFIIQHYVLNNILPAHIGFFNTMHLQWILPILVCVFSSLSIYSIIKRRLCNLSSGCTIPPPDHT